MFNKLNLLILALFTLLALAPGCKKKGAEAADAVSAEAVGEKSAAKKNKKKKGKKKKGKDKKSKKTDKKKKKKKKSGEKGTRQGAEDGGPPPTVALPDGTTVKAESPKPGREARPTRETDTDRKRPANRGTMTPPPVKIAVARLLTVTDLNKHLPEKGWIAYGPIQGIPPSETYNSLIYRKPGTNRFVSLLVWDFAEFGTALARWNELLATYPNAEELKDVFTKFAFYSYRNQVTSLTFLEPGKSMVLSISCHSQICNDASLYALAQSVFNRAK